MIGKTKLVYANENRFIILNNYKFISTTVGLAIKFGSTNDLKGKSGIVNLICELLVNAACKKEIFNNPEFYGIKFHHTTEREFTYFSLEHCETKHVSMLKTLLSIVSNLSFTKEDLDRVKKNVMIKINALFDNPHKNLNNIVHDNVFLRQVIGKPVYGKFKSIQSITEEEIMDCYNKYYNKKNMTFIVASPLDNKQVVDEVEDVLINYSKISNSSAFTSFKKYTFHSRSKQIYKNTKSSLVNITFPTKGFKDYHSKIQAELACNIIKEILNAHFKYSYDINCNMTIYNSTGIISINAHVNYSDVRYFVEQVQDKLRNIDITNEQFRRTCMNIVNKYNISENMSQEAAYNFVCHFIHLRKVKKLNLDLDIMKLFTKDIIKDFVNQLVNSGLMSIFCLGPRIDKENAKAIGIN